MTNRFFSSFSVLFDTSRFVKEEMSDGLKIIYNDSLIQYSDYNKYKFKLSGINSNLSRLSDAVIFPLPILKDLIRNDFETLEYKKFKEEKKQNETTLILTRKSLKQTRWSILISAIGCIAACASAIIAYRSSERLYLNKNIQLDGRELLNRRDSLQYVNPYLDSNNSLKGSK